MKMGAPRLIAIDEHGHFIPPRDSQMIPLALPGAPVSGNIDFGLVVFVNLRKDAPLGGPAKLESDMAVARLPEKLLALVRRGVEVHPNPQFNGAALLAYVPFRQVIDRPCPCGHLFIVVADGIA